MQSFLEVVLCGRRRISPSGSPGEGASNWRVEPPRIGGARSVRMLVSAFFAAELDRPYRVRSAFGAGHGVDADIDDDRAARP